MEEIEQALAAMPDGKVPGMDDIQAEIWKATRAIANTLLWKLCVKIWEKREKSID